MSCEFSEHKFHLFKVCFHEPILPLGPRAGNEELDVLLNSLHFAKDIGALLFCVIGLFRVVAPGS